MSWPRTFYLLGMTSLELGRPAEALNLLNKSRQHGPRISNFSLKQGVERLPQLQFESGFRALWHAIAPLKSEIDSSMEEGSTRVLAGRSSCRGKKRKEESQHSPLDMTS